MHGTSPRRTFLRLSTLLLGAAAAEAGLAGPAAAGAGMRVGVRLGWHAAARAGRAGGAPIGVGGAPTGVASATEMVELEPVLSDAAFPERSAMPPYRYNGPNLREASGIVASHAHPGVLWIIRDGLANADDPVLAGYRGCLLAVRFDAAKGQLVRWDEGVPQTSCDRYLKYLRVIGDGGAPIHGDIEDVALDLGAAGSPATPGAAAALGVAAFPPGVPVPPGVPARPAALWLGAIGNNRNEARAGHLYRCPEPDPLVDTTVTVAATVEFWTRPDHAGPQANCEALFVAGGVPYVVVKSGPAGAGLAPGQVLRLAAEPGPAGPIDAVEVATLPPAPGTAWGRNYRPNAADLHGDGLLLSTGTRWLRYQGDPSLTGDDLIRDLAARPPAEWATWNADASPSGNEAIAWLPSTAAPSFLALSETARFRWAHPAPSSRSTSQ